MSTLKVRSAVTDSAAEAEAPEVLYLYADDSPVPFGALTVMPLSDGLVVRLAAREGAELRTIPGAALLSTGRPT